MFTMVYFKTVVKRPYVRVRTSDKQTLQEVFSALQQNNPSARMKDEGDRLMVHVMFDQHQNTDFELGFWLVGKPTSTVPRHPPTESCTAGGG
jgi:hypothetical protein